MTLARLDPVPEALGLEDHPHPIAGGRHRCLIAELGLHRGAGQGDAVDDDLLLDLGVPLAVLAVGDRLHLAAGEVLAQPVALLGAHDRQRRHLPEALLTDHRGADAGAVVQFNRHGSDGGWCSGVVGVQGRRRAASGDGRRR